MRAYLQEVATGPELSRSLSREQAADAGRMILSGQVSEVQAAILLIALRMKRETEAENLGMLDALNEQMQTALTDCDELVVLTDPFNGFLRGLPASPFLGALLAACGMPAVVHGVLRAGPKNGLTPHLVLNAAGVDTGLNPVAAAARLDESGCGWAYLDQRLSAKSLHDLIPLRDQMVKRTCLSTLEVVMRPLIARQRTHLMTGFVHKAYPRQYQILAEAAGFDSAMIIRGVEGGCVPSLSQLSRYFAWHRASQDAVAADVELLKLHKLVPAVCGIHQQIRAPRVPEEFQQALNCVQEASPDALRPLAAHAASLGLEALSGRPGPMMDSLIYGASICLSHTGLAETLAEGAATAAQAMRSGRARAHFEAGCRS